MSSEAKGLWYCPVHAWRGTGGAIGWVAGCMLDVLACLLAVCVCVFSSAGSFLFPASFLLPASPSMDINDLYLCADGNGKDRISIIQLPTSYVYLYSHLENRCYLLPKTTDTSKQVVAPPLPPRGYPRELLEALNSPIDGLPKAHPRERITPPGLHTMQDYGNIPARGTDGPRRVTVNSSPPGPSGFPYRRAGTYHTPQ